MRRLSTSAFLLLSSCWVAEYDKIGDPKFPIEPHRLYPLYLPSTGQLAAGAVTGKDDALEQPIPFSHNIHAETLAIQCEYCHSEARRSIHGGVPPLQTCMGCHQTVKTDNPDVQKIHQAWCGQPNCKVEEDVFGTPVAPAAATIPPWQKVHDLPDYVYFAHKRHIRAGLACTECHGQVTLQGAKEIVPNEAGTADAASVSAVRTVMTRESSLQMGWCLDCHAIHPSIDQNYGEKADLRRAELKDCWTCHK